MKRYHDSKFVSPGWTQQERWNKHRFEGGESSPHKTPKVTPATGRWGWGVFTQTLRQILPKWWTNSPKIKKEHDSSRIFQTTLRVFFHQEKTEAIWFFFWALFLVIGIFPPICQGSQVGTPRTARMEAGNPWVELDRWVPTIGMVSRVLQKDPSVLLRGIIRSTLGVSFYPPWN